MHRPRSDSRKSTRPTKSFPTPIAGLRMTGSAMRPMAWAATRSADSAASPFGDLFESFFGGGNSRRRTGPTRGQDLTISVSLTFEEAVFGVEKEVEVLRLETCESCHGTRMKDGQTPPRCATCGGTGEIRRVQQTILGQFMTSNPCPACRGEGVTITDPCPTCRGRGRTSQSRKINVTVPAGIDENQTLRLSGQGEAGPAGGPAGQPVRQLQHQVACAFQPAGQADHLCRRDQCGAGDARRRN